MVTAIELERYLITIIIIIIIIIIIVVVGWVLFIANSEIANIRLGTLESERLLMLAARKSNVWNELGEALCTALSTGNSRTSMGVGAELIGRGGCVCHAERGGDRGRRWEKESKKEVVKEMEKQK
jgi:hypothetical protein